MSDLLTFLSDGLHRTLLPMWVAVVLLWLLERFVVALTPRHRCWLWRLLFLKCIVVFFLPLGLPMPALLLPSLPVPSLSLGNSDAAVEPTVGAVAGAGDFAPLAIANPSAGSATAVGGLATQVPSTSGTLDVASGTPTVASGLLLLWSLGVCIHMALLVHHHGVLSARLRRGNVSTLPDSVRTLYVDVARQMQVHRPPRLRLNDRFSSPALVCHGRAQIVLPVNFLDQHGADACRVALAHELAHYRRHDLFWNTLVVVVSIGLFFFPPLWLARRRYRLAMESACDWDAIRYGRVGLAMYARLLIAVLDAKPSRSPALGIVPMSGSETFRSLSERLVVMKRFHLLSCGGWTPRALAPRALVSLVMLCVLVPWTRADDRYQEKTPQRSPGSQSPQPLPSSQGSSASVSGFSASSIGPGGRVISNSRMNATATGDAFSSGATAGRAMARGPRTRNGTSSSASGTARSNPPAAAGSPRLDRYGFPVVAGNVEELVPGAGSSSSSSITVNDIRLTRTVQANDEETVSRLDVVDKKKEYSVRESSLGPIEVRVRDHRKDDGGQLDEKVYTAADRNELKRNEPQLVRTIQRYEKLASKLQVSADVEAGGAFTQAASGNLDLPQGDLGGDAQQMMLDQLRQMQQQHADNPQLQGMLQKMIEDVEESSP